MAQDLIEMDFSSDDFGLELWEELQAAEKSLSLVRGKVRTAILNSDKFAFFKAMTGAGASYYPDQVKYDANCNPSISRTVKRPSGTSVFNGPSPLAYISDKTINVLLGGKLLEDDQKKAMVKLMVPALFDDVEGKGDVDGTH